MRSCLPLLLLLLLPGSAAAQASPRPPDCTGAEHRAFDFWLGSWAVTDSAGAQRYGTNTITATEKGCLLHERWTAAGGNSGQSFNFYDRRRQRWEQVWIDATGGVLKLAGNPEGGAMVMRGEGRTPAGGVTIQEIRWSLEADGRVRQLWRTSADDGANWQAVFDSWYRRE